MFFLNWSGGVGGNNWFEKVKSNLDRPETWLIIIKYSGKYDKSVIYIISHREYLGKLMLKSQVRWNNEICLNDVAASTEDY